MFVIWGHSPFFKTMASLSIVLAELSVLRALGENNRHWMKAMLTLCVSLFIQKGISDYILGIPNITIL